uniref:Single-stranded DNA-binding protein n=1 Tax=Siphoviridae sp. ctg5k4 TaxID=2826418 RepID=A0A8S5M8L6_9CAUD|nr:MAG TPA: Single strand binding protein [Siphoviridae sp. ctg5k4]
MNTVQLVGRLTRDVELKFTASGTATGSFNLAVNRNFTNQQGEREADFINCVIWRKAAENLANWTRKGSLIAIDGRLQTRSYENRNGQKVYVTEVVVNNFDLLESKETTNNRAVQQYSQQQQGQGQAQSYNQGNYNTQGHNSMQASFGSDASFMNEGHPIDVSEDDLPF